MTELETRIEWLLDTEESFTNKRLTEVTRLKRQAVAYHLKRYVACGYLEKHGDGRGARYRRGRPVDPRFVDPAHFWSWMAAEFPLMSYVPMKSLGSRLASPDRITSLMEPHRFKPFIVLDFHGVETITEAFADELFSCWAGAFGRRPEPINMAPSVKALVDRVRHRELDPEG